MTNQTPFVSCSGINTITLPPKIQGVQCVAITSLDPFGSIASCSIYLSWTNSSPITTPDMVASSSDLPIFITDPSVATVNTIYMFGAVGTNFIAAWVNGPEG